MYILRGEGASPGVVTGRAFLFGGREAAGGEPARDLEEAVARVRDRLERAAASAGASAGAQAAAIFAAQRTLAADPAFAKRVRTLTGSGMALTAAVIAAGEEYAGKLEALKDEYLRARATDVRQVAAQLTRELAGVGHTLATALAGQGPVVVFAEELTPLDTFDMDPGQVQAVVTAKGGPTSHTAIIARALGMPAVVGTGPFPSGVEGCEVAVDGEEGLVVIGPEGGIERTLRARARAWAGREGPCGAGPARTRDGLEVPLLANVGGAAEVTAALRAGACGIGLLRTEFLFLGREVPPGEEEQYLTYRRLLERMEGRPVIARLLDIGGDKPLPGLGLAPEANPFLGVRGARLLLARSELLDTQLRALLRASAHGNLSLMYPMVHDLPQVGQLKAAYSRACAALSQRGSGWREARQGIMVELPSAAILAGQLAPGVDFFSLGTNDLAGYTLAADRTNPAVASLADALHPAVLALIGGTCDAAAAARKPCGACGELAGHAPAAPLLVGLGVTSLSAGPAALARVRDSLGRYTMPECRRLAAEALRCTSGDEVRALLG
ncbi:MAG: phosphoenolpyruvate--protein phosphotransferase [Bacillota bacterium]